MKKSLTPLASNGKPTSKLGQASGHSQAAYCKTHDLVPHVFSYWKKRLSGPPASARTRPADVTRLKAALVLYLPLFL